MLWYYITTILCYKIYACWDASKKIIHHINVLQWLWGNKELLIENCKLVLFHWRFVWLLNRLESAVIAKSRYSSKLAIGPHSWYYRLDVFQTFPKNNLIFSLYEVKKRSNLSNSFLLSFLPSVGSGTGREAASAGDVSAEPRKQGEGGGVSGDVRGGGLLCASPQRWSAAAFPDVARARTTSENAQQTRRRICKVPCRR